MLEEGNERLRRLMRAGQIRGADVEARLGGYLDVLGAYYGSREYLAFMQVLLALAHDPRTSAQTLATVQRISGSVESDMHRLAGEVLAGTGADEAELGPVLFHALRGMAMSHLMISALPPTLGAGRGGAGRTAEFAAQRAGLARALGLLVADRTGPFDD